MKIIISVREQCWVDFTCSKQIVKRHKSGTPSWRTARLHRLLCEGNFYVTFEEKMEFGETRVSFLRRREEQNYLRDCRIFQQSTTIDVLPRPWSLEMSNIQRYTVMQEARVAKEKLGKWLHHRRVFKTEQSVLKKHVWIIFKFF